MKRTILYLLAVVSLCCGCDKEKNALREGNKQFEKKAFDKAVRSHCVDMDYSRERLAQIMEVAQGTISNHSRAPGKMSVDMLRKYVKKLNIKADELCAIFGISYKS